MNRNKILASVFAFLGLANISAQNYDEKKEEIKHRFSYLSMNGEFRMDKNNVETINDPRNPSRLILSTSSEKGSSTTMTFYDHNDDQKIIAKCEYQYIGSRPDPYYFPNTSKTSIWDIFEKTADIEGDCDKFKFVISRSPHDNPLHMHLRYGKNVEKLLNMSKDKKDDKYNPWWSEYKG